MATQGKVKVARPYQIEAFREYDPSADWLIEQPTGSGKTLLIVALVAKHLPRVGHAIIAAPMTHIADGFIRRDFDAVDVGGEVIETPAELVREAKTSTRKAMASIADYLSGPADHALATTHKALASLDGNTLPAKLDGKLLVIDEAHHVGADALGRVAREWTSRGGMLLLATATPYRHDGKPVATAGTKVIRRSLAEHMEEGYAPRSFVSGIVPFGHRGRKVAAAEFVGARASRGLETKIAALLVDRWKEDGAPKLIVRVPPLEGGSAPLVAEILKRFGKAGTRTLDATGMKAEDKRRVRAWIESEKHGDYRRSQFDVVVGSQRVIEGTDWPSCSTVYCLGLPGSIGMVAQLIGRTTRPKPEGYPARHRDVSTIRFFVATSGGEAMEQLPIKHSRNALLVCAYLATAGHGANQAVGRCLEEGRYLQFNSLQIAEGTALIAVAKARLEAEGKPACAGSIVNRAIADNPEIERALVAEAAVRLMAAEPRVMARLSRDPKFEAVLAEFREQTLDGSPVLASIGAQSHELTAGGISDFARRLGSSILLTEELILAKMVEFHEKTGRYPSQRSGCINGYVGEQWSKWDACLRIGNRGLQGGSSLWKLKVERLGSSKKEPLTAQLITTALIAYHSKHGKYPVATSGPVEGYPGLTWGRCDESLRKGGRGLPGGSSLAAIRGTITGNAPRKPSALSLAKIVDAIRLHIKTRGRPPVTRSGVIPSIPNCTWTYIDSILKKGRRGLPGGSSLAKLTREFVRPHRTIEQIIVAMKEHRDRAGRYPSRLAGQVRGYPGETWALWDAAMQNGYRGLPGGSSLAKLKRQIIAEDEAKAIAAGAPPETPKATRRKPGRRKAS